MTLPRLAAAVAGLVLPVLLATPVDAAPRHSVQHGAPAHYVTVAERPASVQFVARHRHHHRSRHYSQRPRRHG